MERAPLNVTETVGSGISGARRLLAMNEVQAAVADREPGEQVQELQKMLDEYGAVIPGTDQAANESMYYHVEAAAELLAKMMPDPARVYAESITPTNVDEYKIAA